MGCEHNNKTCMELVPIFSNLTFEEMMELSRITVDRKYEKGEMIYTAGDSGEKLFVIHRGKVKITRFSISGKEQVIRILEPGDFMGELSLFSHTPRIDNAEALEDTIVCIIGRDEMRELMTKYPTIALKVLEELSCRLGRAENLIEHLGIHDVETRIIETLFAWKDENGEVILGMSKRDWASYIGMSQETLSRKLSYFQDMNWIRMVGHRKIIILDEESLKALV
ncbi:Crp/Fnr family transcriptional regulator [Anaerosalibacter bizertensis]|uniref:Crp/Fnr family transcriptional regulator n=1 Tax=Anaerosalibacter bizertensis TaxID=932217 RepID=A0A9Q4FKZ8_9FIRM|nr:Crp/Fnr family transcriptional regulator [Anaerosalibacter bizertensis]MBV1818441.1 Crp/Fnr family transcriptional regulator [Bacteroidales bacterium MSK.15.36]MCB5559017.1 Crp/Fnr family transcriptional regulator [Anaerosalibacter bizertensis]MCG4564323.1 Crp/Fnr family transcriptional regulator [Anaerosalibacter bizertensis]MCG4581504.1 Crp/Fnr family transcriptional regulator [Anaerosalibacter bizertensis]MCG4584189.1 Crp/Fnr family transcriptional regulator [Anaerosalibacter bizertensis